MQITHNDLLNIERELGKRSFAHFVKMAWQVIEPSTELKWGWALDVMCAHLQAVTEGKFNRLLMNVPPGMMKSLLTGVFWPAWEWIEHPHLRYISTAHAERLAVRDNMKCRRLVQSAWYQERWPLALMSDNNAKLRFENNATGFREAMSFTGMTGSRGDRVILDDSLSVDDGNSKAALDAAELTFREALPTRVNNDQSAIVVICQRLNERDTSGIILSGGFDYVHLCLPMEFEPDRICITPIFIDPRVHEGELLFPERFPQSNVDSLKKSLGTYASAGQLQQRPSPRGGGIFQAMWWQFYDIVPRCQFRVIYVDTAQKDGEQNDYSVFQCWGLTFEGKAALLDQLRGKWEAPELLVQARAFWNKHNALVDGNPRNGILRNMKIEDKSSGTGLIQQLQRGDGEKNIPAVPVVGIPRTRDKVSRAYDTTPRIESGMVLLPREAAWLSDYLAEFSAFPNGSNDDMVDPTMDAVADLLGGAVTDFSKVF